MYRIFPQTPFQAVVFHIATLPLAWLCIKMAGTNTPTPLLYFAYFTLLFIGCGLGFFLLEWLRKEPWMTKDRAYQIIIGSILCLVVSLFEVLLLGFPAAGLIMLLGWSFNFTLDTSHFSRTP